MSDSLLDPLAWIDAELERLAGAGLRRQLAVRHGPQTSQVELDGRGLVNFGSNDYLGLAADPRLAEAARAAIDEEGWGSGASPLVSGRSAIHAALEREIAEFEGTEAALVFPSGFAANAGVIPALVDQPDALFADAKNHASLNDGCRLARATRFVYRHADCDSLERKLREAGRFRRRLIVTDSLFSMDGDLAPLVRLAELAERYDAMLMIDEAHATGVFGQHGRGVVEHLGSVPFSAADEGTDLLCRKPSVGDLSEAGSGVGRRAQSASETPPTTESKSPSETPPAGDLHQRVHIRIGTLSKALGSGGGFVCGRQSLIDWLANRARTYVFSTAQPAAASAAARTALRIVRQEPQRRSELLSRAAELRQRLRAQGWDTGRSASQIIPLAIGDSERTMRLAGALREAGLFVPGIRPPSIPKGESLLRISLCHHHTPEVIDVLVAAFARLHSLTS